jgi:hypothetical protein
MFKTIPASIREISEVRRQSFGCGFARLRRPKKSVVLS